MIRNRTTKFQPPIEEPLDQALIKSMHRFAEAQLDSLGLQSVDPAIWARSISRPLAFADRIIRKRNRPLGADPLAFLKSCFDEKFAPGEMQGWPGSMIYKAPGGFLRKSFYTWLVESALSLSVSQMMRCFNIWLNGASTARFLSTVKRSTLLHEPSITQHRVFSSVLPLMTVVHSESKTALQAVEKVLRTFFEREAAPQVKTVGMHPGDFGTSVFHTNFQWLTLYAGGRGDSLPHDLQRQMGGFPRIGFMAGERRYRSIYGSAFHERMPPAAEFIRWEPTVESIPPLESIVWWALPTKPLPQPLSYEERGVNRWAMPLQLLEFVLSPQRRPLAGETEMTPERLPMHDFPLVEALSTAEASSAPVLNRKLVASAIHGFENGDGPESVVRDFTFLRREAPLELPQPSYVFAQPMRPIDEEQQVVKRVEEKEVVEIVKKEVQTVMSSSSPMTNFSRADYSRIVDGVYATLVRRLMVEKERLGLR